MGCVDTLNTWDGTTEYIYSSVIMKTTTYFDVSVHTTLLLVLGITQNGVYQRNWKYRNFGLELVQPAGNTTSSNGWTLNTSIPNSVALDGDPVYVPLMSPIVFSLVMLLVLLYILQLRTTLH